MFRKQPQAFLALPKDASSGLRASIVETLDRHDVRSVPAEEGPAPSVTLLRDSDLVIADITGGNPNVMVEVGMALGLGKQILLLAQRRSSDVPVDLAAHQVAVYEPGVTPEDIDVPPFGPPADPTFDNIFINDGDGLLFPMPPPTVSTTSPAGAFATPGKYLMICNVTPHFLFAKMYGWIEVK